MAKYDALRIELTKRNQPHITMTFDEINKVVPGGLPPSAYQYQAWWANEQKPLHPQKIAWGEAGYKVDHLDLNTRTVRFIRRGACK